MGAELIEGMELIVVGGKILIGLKQPVLEAKDLYVINEISEEPESVHCNTANGNRRMVFGNKEWALRAESAINNQYPEMIMQVAECGLFNKDEDIYILGTENYYEQNDVVLGIISSLESNPEYIHMVETDSLFYSIIYEIVSNIWEDNNSVSDTIVNVIFSFVSVYKNILSSIGDSFQDEQSQAKIQQAVTKMTEMFS